MTGKIVLITGCSAGGIGHALVLAFQQRGAIVFATARSVKKMDDLANLPNVHLLSLDVTSAESIATAVKEVEAKTGGRLDVLVNNAGVQYVMPAIHVNIDKAKDTFEANYWGPIRMVNAFKDMLLQTKGTIVNMSSIAGIVPVPWSSQYNASKAAMKLWSDTLRLELAPFGIKVVTLLAGNVVSNMGTYAPPSLQLPPDSPYKPIEKDIEGPGEWNMMSTSKFADEAASQILNGISAPMWKGVNTPLVRWLVPFMPQFIFDKLMVMNGRGLSKLG